MILSYITRQTIAYVSLLRDKNTSELLAQAEEEDDDDEVVKHENNVVLFFIKITEKYVNYVRFTLNCV